MNRPYEGEWKLEADKFGKTEGRLYRYFENIKRIASLNEQNVEWIKEYVM